MVDAVTDDADSFSSMTMTTCASPFAEPVAWVVFEGTAVAGAAVVATVDAGEAVATVDAGEAEATVDRGEADSTVGAGDPDARVGAREAAATPLGCDVLASPVGDWPDGEAQAATMAAVSTSAPDLTAATGKRRFNDGP